MTRSGPASADEFARALRRLRVASGRTQQNVAEALSVRRPTYTQWESGRFLPSEANVEALDRLLGGDGELVRAAGAAPTAPGPTTPTAYEIFRRIGRILVEEMARDDDGRPLGWRRDFGHRPPSPLSTATGIRLLALVDTPFVDLAELGRSLAAMEDSSGSSGGGWGARGFRGRPEVTALVMDALARIGGPMDSDRLVGVLGRQTTDRALGQVHVTSEVLRSLAPLRTDAELTGKVVRALLGTRVEHGAWPEKRATRPGIPPQPSPAHTARAVIALGTYRECGGEVEGPEVDAAIDAATAWLDDQQDRYYPVRENLEPSPDDPEYGDLEIRHFTGALVAQALLRHRPTSHAAVDAAIEATWRYYYRDAGLWAWPNGDTPIWMQHEGVLAIMLLLQRRHHAPRTDTSPPPRLPEDR